MAPEYAVLGHLSVKLDVGRNKDMYPTVRGAGADVSHPEILDYKMKVKQHISHNLKNFHWWCSYFSKFILEFNQHYSFIM